MKASSKRLDKVDRDQERWLVDFVKGWGINLRYLKVEDF